MLLMYADFFQNKLFQRNSFRNTFRLTEYQMVWIQIRTDLSLLVWVLTVCKGKQQMTKVGASKGRVGDTVKPCGFNTFFMLNSRA